MRPTSPSLLPAALAGQTLESLYALHGRRRPWVYWTALAGIVLALAVLPLVEVDVTVRAPGMVRPATERAEMRVPVGGHIARIRARDNEPVKAGQILVELATGDIAERLARNGALQGEKARLIDDLALITTELADLAKGETAGAVPGPDLGAALHTAALAQAVAHFAAEVDTRRLVVEKTAASWARAKALAAKGIVSAQEGDEARFARQRAEAELRLAVQQALAGWQVQLRDESLARDQLVSEEKRLREEIALAQIRAPVAGSVQGLVGLGEGAYVAAGQSLGFVSPAGTLQVETVVSPRDIGLVREGQAVRMQVDAFPYTRWGLLDGTVLSVAADAAGNGAQPAFRVIVDPSATVLRLPGGARGDLRKGMTLTARFVVARRSLLQIFYQDAAQWADPRQAKPA